MPSAQLAAAASGGQTTRGTYIAAGVDLLELLWRDGGEPTFGVWAFAIAIALSRFSVRIQIKIIATDKVQRCGAKSWA